MEAMLRQRVLRPRFGVRRSTARRMLLAAVTSWSLSATACVPYNPYMRRYREEPQPEPTPVLTGRDSLSRAYNLGLDDGTRSWRSPVAGVRGAILAVALLGGFILAAATKNILAVVYSGVAAAGGLVIVGAHESNQGVSPPADSMQTVRGLRSPQMWESYLSGYRDGAEVRRDSDVKTTYVSAGVAVLFSAAAYFLLLFLKAVRKAVSSA